MNDLTKLNLTAETLPAVAEELIRKVKDGEINPLDISIQFKIMNDLQKLVKTKEINDLMVAEAGKWEKQPFKYGFSPNIGSNSEYKYDDSEITALEKEIEKLDDKLKARQKMLRGLEKPMIDSETGEELRPPKKETTYFVKWAK